MDPTNIERLHAYWRMEYVESPKTPKGSYENPFANLDRKESDTEDYIIHRGKTTCIVLNKYPYNCGHLLALPYRSVPNLSDLSTEENNDLMQAIIKAQDILQQALQPQGFNIGLNLGPAGGVGIAEHLHWHIVPRWTGDTNFMPTLANTKVLHASLEHMYQRLKQFA